MALRKAEPVLRLGRLERIAADGDLLSFERWHDNRRIRLAFNFGAEPAEIALEGAVWAEVNGATPDLLPPLGAIAVEG